VVLRAEGQVGCAHCTKLEADRACQVCKRMVCPRCAADWATCSEPSGRIVRLGLTARVRDVDPLGRFALVSHWRKPLRIFDLRALRWVEGVQFPSRLFLWTRPYAPRLTADQHLIHADISIASDLVKSTAALSDVTYVGGFRIVSIANGESTWLVEPSVEAPFFGTSVSSEGDVFSFITGTQQVVIARRLPLQLTPPGAALVSLSSAAATPPQLPLVQIFDPLPRKVVQAVHVDGERDLLLSATWSQLALHRMERGYGGRLESLGHAKTDASGDVKWVAVAGAHVAAAVHDLSRGTQIEVRELTPSRAIGALVSTISFQRDFRCAALSRDGRFLAVAFGRRLTLHELETRRIVDFEEHTDAINYVRFAADDHVLVSSDTDNRVVLRPRTAAGYGAPLLPVDI
jgi:hypothetical protein